MRPVVSERPATREDGGQTPLRRGLIRFLGKLSRFAGVGAVSGLVYAGITAIAISGFAISNVMASAIGYAGVLPMNFLLQRMYTFRSRGVVSTEAWRYLITQGTNAALCMGAMKVSDLFDLHYGFGIIGAIVLVPLVTYFVMDKFVFRHQTIP